MSDRRHILGIDIGGTFTDVLAVDVETGELSVAKVPTVPGSLVDGIVAGVEELGLELGAVSRIVHGSTTCTNALIEGKQARTGFIGTRGFSDEFDIQRMARRWAKTPSAAIYDLHQTKPAPFVARRLRREVDERTLYSGEILEPLDVGQLDEAARELIAHGAEAIAICFLWSPVNDSHERQAKAQLANLVPSGFVSISTEVAPVIREYERMVTTAVNASLLPVLGGYLQSVDERLHDHGFRGRLLLMQSHGGVSGPDALRELPVLTLRGGPVGGAVAASFLARRLERPRVISCDIGGTSCDTALVLDYEVPIADGTEVDYYPIRIPTSDIRCIGAGGGSIASIDAGGALRVGPESAGSSPGPACYERGGTLPTLTDANLVLGRIGAGALASGIELSVDRARLSLEGLARSLGMAVEAVAEGIVTIAVANMADSIRLQTVDRGHDPRELTLIAFGGAGPLHATLLAQACSIPEVVIPVAPGVFSSLGMIVADHGYYTRSSYLVALDEADGADLERRFSELEREAALQLAHDTGETLSLLRRSAAMRYVLQEWELPVELPARRPDSVDLEKICDRFHRAHHARYGFSREDRPVEFVALFVSAAVPAPPVTYGATPAGAASAGADARTWPVIIDPREDAVNVAVHARAQLQPGDELHGPLVVTEPTSTIYVQPGWDVVVDPMGNLVARAA
ncbi:MAG: hydantoinase/oxoprolinase family protein [Gaiellaceae bacterium]